MQGIMIETKLHNIWLSWNSLSDPLFLSQPVQRLSSQLGKSEEVGSCFTECIY